MNPFDPTISHLRIERPPGQFKPRPVEIGAQLVHARHPDHHWSRVCDKAETFLTLAQSRFDALTLCDVYNRAEHEFTLRRLQGIQTNFDCHFSAIFSTPVQVSTSAHGPGLRISEKVITEPRMIVVKTFWDQHFNRFAHQLPAVI